jgi:hypothetical protein
MNVASTPLGNQNQIVFAQGQLQGEKEVNFILSSTSDGASTNVIMLPDQFTADDYFTAQTLSVGLGHANARYSSASFAAFKNFVTAMGRQALLISKMRIETDDQENFKQSLQFIKTDPTGQTETVKRDLMGLRRSLGNGYASDIDVDLEFIKEPNWKVVIPNIKVSTYMNITLYFKGVADVYSFRPYSVKQIG